MKKLAEVEEAKALMTEGLSWSVMRWLTEKKRVRKTADKANDLCWAMQKALREQWSGDLRTAYEALAARDDNAPGAQGRQKGKDRPVALDPAAERFVQEVKQLDDAAWTAHMDAEETFDKADKWLSTAKAREGARKAIHSWELYGKALAKAEAAISATKVYD